MPRAKKKIEPVTVSDLRWRQMQTKFTRFQKNRPKLYQSIVTMVVEAGADNGLTPSFGTEMESPPPTALIDFIKQLMELMPTIIQMIQMIIGLFN